MELQRFNNGHPSRSHVYLAIDSVCFLRDKILVYKLVPLCFILGTVRNNHNGIMHLFIPRPGDNVAVDCHVYHR